MLQEVFNLGNDRLWTAASGLGGGVARYQSVCGALLGATVAIGLKEGRSGLDNKPLSDITRPKIQALLAGFKAMFGEVECKRLIPYDFYSPGGFEAFKASDCKQQKCHRYVRYVIETVVREYAERASQ